VGKGRKRHGKSTGRKKKKALREAFSPSSIESEGKIQKKRKSPWGGKRDKESEVSARTIKTDKDSKRE